MHKKKSPNMAYSQKKRSKLDYRRVYFQHNPGLFGCIWFCAYCHRIIIGKQNVVVDHIMPLNNPLGRNSGFNLVAACQSCNSRKSDKVDLRVVEGYSAKIIHSAIFGIQKIIVIGFVSIYAAIQWTLSAIFRLLALPYTQGNYKTMLIATVVYTVVIILLFTNF